MFVKGCMALLLGGALVAACTGSVPPPTGTGQPPLTSSPPLSLTSPQRLDFEHRLRTIEMHVKAALDGIAIDEQAPGL